MVIPSRFEAARAVEQAVLEELEKHSYGEVSTFAVKLALEEGLNNAIKHGNRRDPNKKVSVQFEIGDELAAITITDEGRGFDPRSVPDPTADENLEKPSGRGIMLIRAYMDEACYNACGNQIHMTKRRD